MAYHRPSRSRDWTQPPQQQQQHDQSYASAHPVGLAAARGIQQPQPHRQPSNQSIRQSPGGYGDDSDVISMYSGHQGGYDPNSHYNDPHAGSDHNWDARSTAPMLHHQQSQQSIPPYHGPPTPAAYPPMPSPNMYSPPLPQYGYNQGYGFSGPPPQMYRPLANMRGNITQQKKEIPLNEHGNFEISIPVPSPILSMTPQEVQRGLGDEVAMMRYQACTCEPDLFTNQGFKIRAAEQRRPCELAIVLTMYNEDEVLFCRTMGSVVKNIQHLQSRKNSKTWGDAATGGHGWKKVVVVVVSDGRMKINPRTLKVLGLMGAYQDGIAKDTIRDKDVQAHVFEYTTCVSVDQNGELKPTGVPIQVVFCLKEQNKKKLNSHRWFFNAFCSQLQPNVCVLIDVGTKPSGTSIYHLWKAFDKDKSIGGACGEITVDLGRGCGNLMNPLVAAQNFEYKMSNILDKPLESIFGYISVLPGAFSAYRYRALQADNRGEGPLTAYFKGEKFHEPGHTAGFFESNMYLAEDRVLCFEIVVKKDRGWKLKYVKSAKASTDVPDGLPEFISQRRRWLNGSFFAAVHATVFQFRIWSSGQNFFRKIWLQLEFLYNLFNLIFSWIGLANFYLAFFFLTQSATSTNNPQKNAFGTWGGDVLNIVNKVYIALLFICVVCALGNRPQGSKWAYVGVVTAFALLFCIGLYCAGWTLWLSVPHTFKSWDQIGDLLSTPNFRNIMISLLATYGLYIISSLLHLEPWHMLTSFVQYMMLLPSFVSVLYIYSFCNLHDVSWGTKGQAGPPKDLGGAKGTKKDGKEVVEVHVATRKEDIDANFYAMRKELGIKQVEKESHRDAATKQEDHYRNQRTNLVLFWMGTNMALVIFFTSTTWTQITEDDLHITGGNPYMTFIFWSVAGTSAIRFFGSTWYLLLRMIGH